MFGSWPQLARPSEDLTETERTPPPAPTQLDFPSYGPQHLPNPLTSASSLAFYRLLCSLRRPQDITPEYLKALNLSVTPDVPFQNLLSLPVTDLSKNGSNHFSPQDRLEQAIQELRIPHADAFRVVLRLPPRPGQPRVRLSNTRNFWTGLEKMSQYWDCSIDHYYDIPDPEEETAARRSDTDIEMSNTDHQSSNGPADATPAPGKKMKHVYKGFRTSTGSFTPNYLLEETASALVEIAVWPYNCKLRTPIIPPRLSVGKLLFPVRESFVVGRVPKEKEMARRSVLEGPIMGICCRNETSFHGSSEQSEGRENRDKIAGQGVDSGKGGQDGEWRQVLDLAREVGVMLLLAQERAREGKEEIRPGEGKWWTSTPRWGGGPGGSIESQFPPGASVAEERSSIPTPPPPSLENKAAETQPALNAGVMNGTRTETKTTIPPPDDPTRPSPPAPVPPSTRPKRKATGEAIGGSDGSEDNDNSNDGRPTQHKRSGKSKAKSAAQTEKWQTLRTGPPVWDPKMRYRRIGAPRQPPPPPIAEKDGDAEIRNEDQIFMVSALNHHVALLSMRVSSRYLEWLAGGARGGGVEGGVLESEEEEEQQREEGLQLRRTRWFDLFSEADRVEFVQGLWGVMGWLMREE